MREPVILSCVAFVYMGLIMWATQPTQLCQLSIAPQRRLYLDRAMDGELIARQARRIREIASRETELKGTVEGAACEAAAALAVRHHVPIEMVHLALDRVR